MATLHRLSAHDVKNLNDPGRYADGGGLYLQVSKWNGEHVTKSWLFRYMLYGRARQMGLGAIHDRTLSEARAKADEVRKLLKLEKIDPLEARNAERDARRADEAARITFKGATERFIGVHESGWRNGKHRMQWKNTLRTYAFPTLGSRPVAAIDAALINATLAPIWQEKPETASRVKNRIERIVQWVKDGMPLPTPSKARRVKHHPALPWQELPAFMADVRENESMSARALEFLILTAARTSEVIGARWSEIDLDAKAWTIPAARMKAGKLHRVPLTDRAVEILKSLPRERGNAHVFIGAKAGAGLSQQAMLELLRGMRPGLTVHGFRSSFRDWARESTSYPREIAEAALAHTVKDKVEAAYARGDLFEKRRRLMAEWTRYCGTPRNIGGKVVALRRAPS